MSVTPIRKEFSIVVVEGGIPLHDGKVGLCIQTLPSGRQTCRGVIALGEGEKNPGLAPYQQAEMQKWLEEGIPPGHGGIG